MTAPAHPQVSVLILTKNESSDLPDCLRSVSWSDDVHVFDSFSTDATVELARKANATVTQRQFDNWSAHQNWGLASLPFKHRWVFYLDADERVSPSLLESIGRLDLTGTKHAAFEVRRRDFAWNGRWLKHAQISPFYLRLFRPEKMRYERLVNPVSHVDGTVGRVSGYLDHYPFSKGIKFWLQRHLGYAEMEARIRFDSQQAEGDFSLSKALFASDFTERRMHQKKLFYTLPARPVVKWFYMVLLRRAFLDGSSGVTYSTLQAIYEYFIVLRERELHSTRPSVRV